MLGLGGPKELIFSCGALVFSEAGNIPSNLVCGKFACGLLSCGLPVNSR